MLTAHCVVSAPAASQSSHASMIRCSSGHETAMYWNIRDTRANNKGGAVEHAGKNGGIDVISDWDDGATTSTSPSPGVSARAQCKIGWKD